MRRTVFLENLLTPGTIISRRRLTTMATPYKIHITPDNVGLWQATQTDEAAKKASELLQKDLAKHHVFFNKDGFHNHIPHHILALYGTGAPPSSLQSGYDHNTTYQRSVLPTHDNVVSSLSSWDHASDRLGEESHYPDFLRFFQREIETHGPEATLTTFLLSGTPAADDMLSRLYSGFLHPLIQLMYGLEWSQPAIIAEALAQTAVHSDAPLHSFLLEAESLSRKAQHPPLLDIASLLQEIHTSPALSQSASFRDPNKIRDGVLARARSDMLTLASRVRIPVSSLSEATAQMFHTSLLTASLSALPFHPPKYPKFDFFLIHHVNAAPMFVTLNKLDWIPAETKARLLEWKVRMDLVQYAARGAPELDLERLKEYEGMGEEKGEAEEVVRRLWDFEDDGHAIKLGRAALVCKDVCKGFKEKEWMVIQRDDMWGKVLRLIVDSVEAPGPNWVRSCGFEEAWKVSNLITVKI
ncbi:HypA protein [Immersiella caudata]|uniref:HypA protein n=1 Tax=Immersiella caudata TaxID=314043 RepID=A0AA40C705_9PEZI|nr:HypA protein [Immersiella caudata]